MVAYGLRGLIIVIIHIYRGPSQTVGPDMSRLPTFK